MTFARFCAFTAFTHLLCFAEERQRGSSLPPLETSVSHRDLDLDATSLLQVEKTLHRGKADKEGQGVSQPNMGPDTPEKNTTAWRIRANAELNPPRNTPTKCCGVGYIINKEGEDQPGAGPPERYEQPGAGPPGGYEQPGDYDPGEDQPEVKPWHGRHSIKNVPRAKWTGHSITWEYNPGKFVQKGTYNGYAWFTRHLPAPKNKYTYYLDEGSLYFQWNDDPPKRLPKFRIVPKRKAWGSVDDQDEGRRHLSEVATVLRTWPIGADPAFSALPYNTAGISSFKDTDGSHVAQYINAPDVHIVDNCLHRLCRRATHCVLESNWPQEKYTANVPIDTASNSTSGTVGGAKNATDGSHQGTRSAASSPATIPIPDFGRVRSIAKEAVENLPKGPANNVRSIAKEAVEGSLPKGPANNVRSIAKAFGRVRSIAKEAVENLRKTLGLKTNVPINTASNSSSGAVGGAKLATDGSHQGTRSAAGSPATILVALVVSLAVGPSRALLL